MDRRKFISSSAAVGGALAGVGLFGTRGDAAERPNILFIVVDELRYPTVFPRGIENAGQFLANFMPETYQLLWRNGVKFANHHVASIACSPSRSVMLTGLYSQQSWITQTIKDFPGVTITEQPVLSPAFPTYGTLLRQAGYQTPYIGKWHLSIPSPDTGGLTAYGFDFQTYPDPTGSNLQGTIGDEPDGYHSDQYIEDQATSWLGGRVPGESPWCLTVAFVNPHDKEYFPAGTEYQTFDDLFAITPNAPMQLLPYATQLPASAISFDDNPLRNPPTHGYPVVPPNWESADRIAANKPSTQTFGRIFQQLAFGGVADDASESAFSIAPYPTPPGQYGIGVAPYNYWQRSLDSYTQIMTLLDGHIGALVKALPHAVAQNTLIVFTSDHGDYASAHGFASGKVATTYEEVWKVPLIVVDPRGRFTSDLDVVRDQLTSSIDLTPLLVSLGHNGSRDWITGDLAGLYGRRHDMIPMLRSAEARGRRYVVFATDELVPAKFNFNKSPLHIVGLLTEEAKLGVYANWRPATTTIARDNTLETEFYDYDTAGGRAEVDNTPDDPRARSMLETLLNRIIPDELQAPLPLRFRGPQSVARAKYLLYAGLIDHLESSDTGLKVGL